MALILSVHSAWTLDPIGLRAASHGRQLPLGAGVNMYLMRTNRDHGQYLSHLKKNYLLIVPEVELKPMNLWKGENQYDFTDPDWLLGSTPESTGWVQQNDMQIRGHTLVYATDGYIPQWLLDQESSISREKALSLLKTYIGTVVSRYRGKIWGWDVINEAIEDSPNTKRPFNL